MPLPVGRPKKKKENGETKDKIKMGNKELNR
jgi:hypothetical protein